MAYYNVYVISFLFTYLVKHNIYSNSIKQMPIYNSGFYKTNKLLYVENFWCMFMYDSGYVIKTVYVSVQVQLKYTLCACSGKNKISLKK